MYDELKGLHTETIVFNGSIKTRLYHTYNLAPLTRNESTVYRHTMVTVCSSKDDGSGVHTSIIHQKMMDRVSIHQ